LVLADDDDDHSVDFVIAEDIVSGEIGTGDADIRASGFLSGEGESLDWLGLVTGRGGVVLGAENRWLLYAKGGLAFTEDENGGLDGECATNEGLFSSGSGLEFCRVITSDDLTGGIDDDDDDDDDDDFDDWSVGFTVGGGLEYKLTQNFSIGAEYLFVDLDNGDTDSAVIEYQRSTDASGEVRQLELSQSDDDDELHLFELRATFHFGGGPAL
jgi:opacity protein-like surface antigen